MKILFGNDSTRIKILGVLIGVGLLLINRTYSLGFLVGLAISEVYLQVLNMFVARALSQQRYNWRNGTLIFVARNLLLLVPFILALKFPEYINVFTAILGLLYFKVCIYIKYLFFREKE